MGCYYTLWYNTYAYSLLFYKVYTKRENAGSWNSGLKKEQVGDTYSAQLQKPRNSTEIYFGIKKKYWAKKLLEGTYQVATSLVGAPTPQGAPSGLVGPLLLLRHPLLLYEVFRPRKMKRELAGRNSAATRRNLSRTNLELRQGDPAGVTSLPEGEIVAIVITNAPLIGGNSSPSTSSSAPSHLQTLVHLLYPISVSRLRLVLVRLLVVLITSCS